MRKFSKTLLSLLLVVMMLAGGFPFANFVTKVEAAGAGFHYERTTSVIPGEEYLIVDGSGNALTIRSNPDATTTNTVQYTQSTQVTVSNNQIAGSSSLEALEWEFVQAKSAYGSLGIYYMLKHQNSGAYLWNPNYEVENGGYAGTCLTPFQDAYNGGTFVQFDYSGSYANPDSLVSGNDNSTLSYVNDGLNVRATKDDVTVHFNFQRHTLNASTFPVLTVVQKTGNVNTNAGALHTGIFTNTSDFAGPNASYYNQAIRDLTRNAWNPRSIVIPYIQNTNPYGSTGWSGTIKTLRIDPVDGPGNGYVKDRDFIFDSVILSRGASPAQTLQIWRNDMIQNNGGAPGGQFPSIEYPFTLFETATSGNGIQFKFLKDGTGIFYLTGPASAGNSFRMVRGTAATIYLYKQTTIYSINTSSKF